MIVNEEQFNQAVEQMVRMYRALADLRSQVLPINPGQFCLLAEGPREEIRRLQQELDAYVDLSAEKEYA